jgi:hypothetical protein
MAGGMGVGGRAVPETAILGDFNVGPGSPLATLFSSLVLPAGLRAFQPDGPEPFSGGCSNPRPTFVAPMRDGLQNLGRARAVHPHAWLWEPLEADPTFVLRPMFGTRAVYLDGRLMLCFSARQEPWRGVLVATERVHHAALQADIPDLAPHPVLPKWLYLPESAQGFERTAELLVRLVRRRDPRIGIVPAPRSGRGRSARVTAAGPIRGAPAPRSELNRGAPTNRRGTGPES